MLRLKGYLITPYSEDPVEDYLSHQNHFTESSVTTIKFATRFSMSLRTTGGAEVSSLMVCKNELDVPHGGETYELKEWRGNDDMERQVDPYHGIQY